MFNEDIFNKFSTVNPDSLAKTISIANKWADNFNCQPDKREQFIENYVNIVFNKERPVWFKSVLKDGVEYFLGVISNLYILWDGQQIFFYQLGSYSPNQLPETIAYAHKHSKQLDKVRNAHLKNPSDEHFFALVDTIKFYFYNHYSDKGISPWKLLRKNDLSMTTTLQTLAHLDLAKLRTNSGIYEAKSFSKMTRMETGFKKNRMSYYGGIVDFILKKVREFLGRDIISTLWFLQLHDARLAHWILSAESPKSRIYRIQALRTQSLFCPLVLSQMYAFYPIQKKQLLAPTTEKSLKAFFEEKDNVEYDNSYDHTTTQLVADMTQAIDDGLTWQHHLEQLTKIILIPTKKNELLHDRNFQDKLSYSFWSQLIPVIIQNIIKKNTKLNPNSFLSLPFVLGKGKQHSEYFWYFVAVGLTLGEREPSNRLEWKRFLAFCEYCLPLSPNALFFTPENKDAEDNHGKPALLTPETYDAKSFLMLTKTKMEGYLKGTPVRWKDEYWSFLEERNFQSTFRDTIVWLSKAYRLPPNPKKNEGWEGPDDHLLSNVNILNAKIIASYGSTASETAWRWVQFAIPFVRFKNINDELHIFDRRVTEEVNEIMIAKYGMQILIEWKPGLPNEQWTDGDLTIVELTCQAALIDEGRRQAHCVGGYTHRCCIGESRIYSVRETLSGKTLSTFELYITNNKDHKRIVALRQNQGYNNRNLPENARKLVNKFVNKINREKNPLPYNFYWPKTSNYQEIQKERHALLDELLIKQVNKYNLPRK